MRKVDALKINIFKATGINILTYHGDLNQMLYTSKDSDNISYASLKVINNVGDTNSIFPADEEGDKKHEWVIVHYETTLVGVENL